MRFFIDLSYKGTAYHGWQNQPNAITVQEVLEKALSTLLGEQLSVVGAGRTDTGVHALQMIAHFDYSELDTEQLAYKLNAFLPADISVQSVRQVPDDAHARFHALSREYKYYIHQKKDPFLTDSSYFFKPDLDVKAMNKAAEMLLDHKDFKCFSRSNTDVKTYHCDVDAAVWEQKGYELTFSIKANRFLRNMVRAVVGTLLDVGQHKMSLDDFRSVLDSDDRSKAGASVPAHGLFLTRIKYPESMMQ